MNIKAFTLVLFITEYTLGQAFKRVYENVDFNFQLPRTLFCTGL